MGEGIAKGIGKGMSKGRGKDIFPLYFYYVGVLLVSVSGLVSADDAQLYINQVSQLVLILNWY